MSDLSVHSSHSFLVIKERALDIEALYREAGVALPPTCDLAGLIVDAKALSDAHLTTDGNTISYQLLFRAAFLNRIAGALLPLRGVADSEKFLTKLTSSSLDFFKRHLSPAKDTLWELEFWSILRARSFNASLKEPPDIVVAFEGASIGIACKKFYSEKHVQNVLSQAVRQIEQSFEYGIVALNLDDLLPSDRLLQAPDAEAMGRRMNEINMRFLTKHERHFRKYLGSGRLISAVVSTGVLVDLRNHSPRINLERQSTIWTIPGLPPAKQQQLNRFYESLML